MKSRPNKPSAVYKTTQPPKNFGLSALLWMLVGALIMVLIGVFFYLSPLFSELKRGEPVVQEAPVTPITNPDKPVEFEFYEVLPKQDFHSVPEGVSVQDNAPERSRVAATPDAVVVQSPAQKQAETIDVIEEDRTYDESDETTAGTTYILQIRSYTTAEDADVKRAEVMLAGVDAVVVHRAGANDTHFYQVISTPMTSRSEAGLASEKLRNNGIDAIIVEQKRGN